MSAPSIRLEPAARHGGRVLLWAAITTGFAMSLVALAAGQPLAAIAAAGAIPAALVIMLGDLAVVAVIFILFTNANAVAVKFEGVPFVIGAAVPLLLLLPVWRDVFRKNETVVITPIVPLLFAFVMVQFLGAVFAMQPGVAMENVVTTLIEGLGLYVLLTNAIRTRATLERVLWTLLAAGTFLGLLTIYQHVTDTMANSYHGFAQVNAPPQADHDAALFLATARPAGPVGEPNRYAQVMGMLLPLAMVAFVMRKSWRLKMLALVALVAIGAATGLTLSRGVTVGLGLTVLTAAALRYVPVRYLFACAAVIVVVALAVPRYGARVASLVNVASFLKQGGAASDEDVDNSVKSRATEMLSAALMFAEHPVIGVGPGMYALHYQIYARRIGGVTKLDQQRRSHSLYLDIAAEHGLIGLTLFLVMCGMTLQELRRARERSLATDPVAAHLATGFFLTLVVFLTTSLFLHLAYARYLWMFMGLAAAASRIEPEVEVA